VTAAHVAVIFGWSVAACARPNVAATVVHAVRGVVSPMAEQQDIFGSVDVVVVYAAVNKVECDSAGLPIGAQLIARPWREDVALAAMQAIETAACAREGYPRTPVENV